MRKLISAFLVAVSVLSFTSCEKVSDILNKDEMAPALTFKAAVGYTTADATVKVADEIMFSWEAVAKGANLQSFTIRLNDEDVTGFPNEKIDRKQYEAEYKTSFDKAGEYTLVFIATDKDDLKTTVRIKITVEEVVAPVVELETAVDFNLGHPEQTDFPKVNSVVGIKYETNKDANTAKFIANASNKFVLIADASAITNKQELADAYASGESDATTEFLVKSDVNFVSATYATKVSEVVYLIKTKDLTFASGANKAYFSYQK